MKKFHLGIHYGHNATVAVVSEGKLIFCQSEERLNRIKNSTGFPSLTLNYVYKNVCKKEDVASATLFQKSVGGYLHLKNANFLPIQVGQYLSPEINNKGLFNRSELRWTIGQMRAKLIREKDRKLLAERERYFCDQLDLPRRNVYSMDHHAAHAYSAFANVRHWGEALIFTLDGVGDYVSATVSKMSEGKVSVIKSVDHRNSLGYYYSAVTGLMGMKSGEHEFKVMGLAPYSSPKYFGPILEKLRKLIWVNKEGSIESAFPPTALHYELGKVIRNQRFDNIAGAIQALTEEIILRWVSYWITKTGIRSIAVAGGVFMNVKACQKLLESGVADNMFVVPSAADESTAIGAALWGSTCTEPELMLSPIEDLYLGMTYSDSEIGGMLDHSDIKARYNITRPENINLAVARLLASNNVVARFSNRMEFGARALGNRSILANPSSFENVELINASIKSRDFWMPFTPSILEEDMDRYIIGHEKIFAPYMCITFGTTELAKKHIVAAIHPRDKTARPQCVVRTWNPGYYELIEEFKRLTGIGAVLNTSFNLHGEPNVCSPRDAIHTLDNSELRYLALGPYLLEKFAVKAKI